MGVESFNVQPKIKAEEAPSWKGWDGLVTRMEKYHDRPVSQELYNLWQSREDEILAYIDTALARKGYSFDLFVNQNIPEEESSALFDELWAGRDSTEQRTEKIRVAIDKIIEFVAQYDPSSQEPERLAA